MLGINDVDFPTLLISQRSFADCFKEIVPYINGLEPNFTGFGK